MQAPGELVDLGRTRAGQGFDTVSYPTYVDLRSRNTVFAGVYAYRLEPQPMSLGSEAGALVVNSSQNGGGKDTWVFDP